MAKKHPQYMLVTLPQDDQMAQAHLDNLIASGYRPVAGVGERLLMVGGSEENSKPETSLASMMLGLLSPKPAPFNETAPTIERPAITIQMTGEDAYGDGQEFLHRFRIFMNVGLEMIDALDGSEAPVEEMSLEKAADDLARLIRKGQWIAKACGASFAVGDDVLDWVDENAYQDARFQEFRPVSEYYINASLEGDEPEVALLFKVTHRGRDYEVLPALREAIAQYVKTGQVEDTWSPDDFNWGDAALIVDDLKETLPPWIERVEVIARSGSLARVSHDEALAAGVD